MIQANNVTLRVGKKALFEDVNIKFTEGNCYGLIGANGAGKSTFLKILSGQLEPTNGDVVITPGQRLSFLQQDHFKYDAFTVLDTVIMGNQRLYDIMKEKDAIYMKEDFSDEDGIRASELEGEFAEMNGWEAEWLNGWTAGRRMYGGKGKMQIIGRAVEMRVGERFALPISVLAMMSAPAAVIVIREKTKQPEQKSSSCFMSLV